MKKCANCGCEIKNEEVLCFECNRIDNEAIWKLIQERNKKDNGRRYSLEEIREKRKEILNKKKPE